MSVISASLLVLSILTTPRWTSAAPRKTRSPGNEVPWHLPCGEVLDNEPIPAENLDEEVKNSLGNLRLQHQLTMNDYLTRDYELLYERVSIGVDQHQYIPNWVPGKKDVSHVRKLAKASPRTIANHLPKLHQDLQKFAVAFEELVKDETDPGVRSALVATKSYLLVMLCEVESNLVVLPHLQLPARVQRSIMSDTERDPEDDTRRLIRDWGVLLKYKDYLHAWKHVFGY
ncbi:uncharacterized protein LOC105700245 [Orussus abietinus]|uniref:uncharacterized protein LOC105700245 n=1 Tax=Orussus abietinus TaxID=222816 RepID=UPI000626657A|nr:uncharacterized protein LOC105700245 [Orussus abietinus]